MEFSGQQGEVSIFMLHVYVSPSHYFKLKYVYSMYYYLLSFVQLDDKEFDIPQVETTQTLESILNEVSTFWFDTLS